MTLNRRRFLHNAMTTSAAAALGSSTFSVSAPASAQSLQDSDYRALVCVFLTGGMDCHDVILPFDTPSYEQIAELRGELYAQQGGARAHSALLPLEADNNGDFGERRFALPPELPALASLFEQGNMAVVGNVGPLINPTDALAFSQKSAPLPPKLFSHNDQRVLWQANSPEGALDGWGGLFSDAMLRAIPGASPVFSAISTQGNSVFLTGHETQPFAISGVGGTSIDLVDFTERSFPALHNQLRQLFSASDYQSTNIIQQDLAGKLATSFDSNETYNAIRATAAPLATPFPTGALGRQLASVADAISIRRELGVSRQVFFVGISGFDTHSEQAQTLPDLLRQVDAGVSAFYQSTLELGLADQVTLFTASDFGRTLTINGDGTDHGWGGHHFVVGGNVVGKRIYGSLPPPILGHHQDSGRGRLIPSVSVEQYAATLGQWFGVGPSDITAALPNISNFNQRDLGFMQST